MPELERAARARAEIARSRLERTCPPPSPGLPLLGRVPNRELERDRQLLNHVPYRHVEGALEGMPYPLLLHPLVEVRGFENESPRLKAAQQEGERVVLLVRRAAPASWEEKPVMHG